MRQLKPLPRVHRYRVTLHDTAFRSLPPSFLSLTIDTSVLIGGHWWGASRGTKQGLSRDRTAPLDLDSAELARWTKPLAPCLVRVGGTEADRIRYGFQHDTTEPTSLGGDGALPASESFVLKGRLWERFNHWAGRMGLKVVFTVSAGPETRNSDGQWDPSGAERLFRNTVRKGYPVVAWELGNEVNAYPFLYGLRGGVSSRQYLKDFGVFANLVRRLAPGTQTVGPASAVWPVIGEPHPLIPSLGRSPAAAFLDVLSFHYYPQQSSRGRVAVRRAKMTTMLNARHLDGALRWVRHARKALDSGPGSGAEIWLTEVGHALYGGQAGISDTWLSTPWWLDQLGLLAHAGVSGVFRQSLVGSDYGLLDPSDFSPRTDYFATLLWKTHMGLHVHPQPLVTGPDRRLRAWHHSRDDGTQTVLLINLHRRRTVQVDLGPGTGDLWQLESSGEFTSRQCRLNGIELHGKAGLQAIRKGTPVTAPLDALVLGPLSCTLVVFRR